MTRSTASPSGVVPNGSLESDGALSARSGNPSVEVEGPGAVKRAPRVSSPSTVLRLRRRRLARCFSWSACPGSLSSACHERGSKGAQSRRSHRPEAEVGGDCHHTRPDASSVRYSPKMIVPTTGTELRHDTSGSGFPDADTFCIGARGHPLFVPDEAVVVARAPGRFDVLGGIADYAGGLVLGSRSGRPFWRPRRSPADGRVIAVSGRRRIAVPAADLVEAPLDELAGRFVGRDAWARVRAGAGRAARPERSGSRSQGCGCSSPRRCRRARVSAPRLRSRSPSRRRRPVRSAAALEPRRLALLGHRAEQLVARAPCGSMDQMTATYGEEAHILALICRPAEIVGSFALPAGLAVVGDRLRRAARRLAARLPASPLRDVHGEGAARRDADYLTALRPRGRGGRAASASA